MQITTAKLKNAAGGFEDLGIGADANYITLTNGENFEEAAAEVNNETSHMDLQYEILDTEMRATSPVDVALTRNIAEFSSRELQSDITKMNRARVKNADGWSEDIPIGAAAVNIDLNNDSNVEDTLEALEVKHTLLNNKEQELLELIPRTEVEDSIIAIENADINDSDFRIEGGMEQATYSGKNLFNEDLLIGRTMEGLVWSKVGSSYTLSGTTGATYSYSSNLITSDTPIVTKGTKICLSRSYTFNTTATYTEAVVGLVLKDIDGNIIVQHNNSTNPVIITLEKDIYSIACVWAIRGLSETVSATFKDVYFQLEKGSSATAYEPYVGGTASPNPDYPQDIDVVTGDVEIKVQNKNLFDKTSGIVYGKHYILETGETEDYAADFIQETYIVVKPNTKYCLHSSSNNWLRHIEYNENYNYVYGSTETIFTTKENTKYIRLSTGGDRCEYLQLEESNIATEYSEHEEQTYQLGLGNIELCGNETARDYIKGYTNNWYLNKFWTKRILDGTEDWTTTFADKHTENTVIFTARKFIKDEKIAPYIWDISKTPIRCTHFRQVTGLDLRDNLDIPCVAQWDNIGSGILFRVNQLTVAEWKAYLAEQYANGTPVTLYYLLETSIDELITDNNLISQLNALLPNVYQYDKKYYIITDDKNLSLLSMDYTQDLERKVIQNLDF